MRNKTNRGYQTGLSSKLLGMSQTAPVYDPLTVDLPQEVLPGQWQTVVWNDPVNLMSYVAWVFQSYFGYSKEKAHQLMMQVHKRGRAVVSVGSREQMESDVQAMSGYGLWATIEREAD